MLIPDQPAGRWVRSACARLAVAGGPVKLGDKPRLMVADGLKNARELKLLVRKDDDGNDAACVATWGDPRLIK